jgi:two-component system sensor histidine kinase KdpD
MASAGDGLSSTSPRKGTLRVYLGAAPGVGKTYAMLREGHRLAAEGIDVAIGLVETHDRLETERQIGDLEVIPRKAVAYGAVTIPEMDVAAILARHPDVVLIDELAHTNAPGSDRPKRYLDVEEVLRHGIDVISTVNVQHLESMHGLVAGITGVGVREIIPDGVLDEADEVMLVDLPAGALLDRLEAGKIYPAGRADQALTGFFREGNLTALRELALRRTAEGVDERLTDLMLTHGDSLASASDRVLLLADDDRSWGVVLRTAWRFASSLRGDLLVVAHAPFGEPDQLPADARAGYSLNLQLAEDLGAEVFWQADAGGDIPGLADGLANLIRHERVSMLVTTVSDRKRRSLFGHGVRADFDLVDAVMDRVPHLAVCLLGAGRDRLNDGA